MMIIIPIYFTLVVNSIIQGYVLQEQPVASIVEQTSGVKQSVIAVDPVHPVVCPLGHAVFIPPMQ